MDIQTFLSKLRGRQAGRLVGDPALSLDRAYSSVGVEEVQGRVALAKRRDGVH